MSLSPSFSLIISRLRAAALPTGLTRVFHVDDHSPSTAKTSHFVETRATPDAGKRVLVLFSLSLPPFLPTCLPPCRLLRYPFPRLAWYQMEIAQDTCRRRRRWWRRRSHVDEIFSYSPSDSRIVCFDVHIYLTRISSGVVPPTKVIPATAIHLSREGCTGGVREGR